MNPALVVAGWWVRPMAQSAARAGWRVIALDLFGDRDTRQASVEWRPIGDPSRFAIDGTKLHAELRRAAIEHDAFGWVAGSGFEAQPALLDLADALPLIGLDGAGVATLRDARRWFAALDRLGLEHPPVAFDAESIALRGGPWLVKQQGGSGGWHIRRAKPDERLRQGEFLQQQAAGQSISALFLADGERARVVAISGQLVRPLGRHPFVYHGAFGPTGDDALRACVQQGLDALVPVFGLRGLASADLLVDGASVSWLEINPRPSATMVLYDDRLPQGLMHAHVQACRGELPADVATPQNRHGHRIVYADRAIEVDESLSAALAARGDCHDLPVPGARIAAGEPLCSVGLRGWVADDSALISALDASARAILARCSVGRDGGVNPRIPTLLLDDA